MNSFPAISHGNHMDDPDLVVLRVDEGPYKGTIWSYADVGPVPVGDDQYVINYSCDFMIFALDGVLVEEPTPEQLDAFYQAVGTPFLTWTIEAAKQADS